MTKPKWIENTSEEPAPVEVPLFVAIDDDRGYAACSLDADGYLWLEAGGGIIPGVSADDIERYVALSDVLESIGGAE